MSVLGTLQFRTGVLELSLRLYEPLAGELVQNGGNLTDSITSRLVGGWVALPLTAGCGVIGGVAMGASSNSPSSRFSSSSLFVVMVLVGVLSIERTYVRKARGRCSYGDADCVCVWRHKKHTLNLSA